MKNIRIVFIITTLFIASSCNKTVESKGEIPKNEVIVIDTTSQKELPTKSESVDKNIVDTITDIHFQELSLSINRLIVFDENNELLKVQQDTVSIYAELGETIEGQIISILSDKLTNLNVEQRYETSVTIMDEGPHCDLTNWKHYYSEWKKLEQRSNGKYISDQYEEKDWNKFPDIEMDDLKEKVKEHCGEGWYKLIQNIKSPNEYPSGVSISRYFLRVSGERKDNGKSIVKMIIIELPMGC